MGEIWDNNVVPKKVKQNKRKISQALHRLLYSKDFIPDKFKEIWDAMTPAAGNGYRALYNIQRLYHPKLKIIDYSKELPKQKSQESIGALVNRYCSYFMRESQRGRLYTAREKAELLMQNTLPRYSKTILRRYNNHFKNNKKLDKQLKYVNIAFTLE